MKNIIRLSFLAVLSVGILASCAKKDSTNNNPPAFVSSMSTTLNGTAWTAATVSGVANSGTIDISGTSSNSTQMLITMPSTATPGTYTPSLGGNYDVLYTMTSTDIYYISSGSLVVTSNSGGVVVGTFQGTMTDANSNSITCTGGAFNVKYQ